MPFAATGRSKPHPITAATSHSARTNHVSVPTPACLLASVASPSTSSSQARPAPSARTATAPLWRASITCLKSWPFHSVEQPCIYRRHRKRSQHEAVIVHDRDDLLTPLMFVAGIADAIAALFGNRVGAIAMQDVEIKLVMLRQM